MTVVTTNLSVDQQAYSEVINKTQQQCNSKIEVDVRNNKVIIDGSIVGGNVVGVNIKEVSATADCTLKSTETITIDSVFKNIGEQSIEQSLDVFTQPSFNDANMEVKQSIRNKISNTTQQTCNSFANIKATDNLLILKNSKVDGDVVGVEITQSNAEAFCTLANQTKIGIRNDLDNQSTQTIEQTGVLANLFKIIAVVVAVVVIGIVIALIFGGFKFLSGVVGNKGAAAPEQRVQSQQSFLPPQQQPSYYPPPPSQQMYIPPQMYPQQQVPFSLPSSRPYFSALSSPASYGPYSVY